MCRALLYLGEPVLLDHFLYQPDSALVRQSYMPKMLNMLNLAGFGLRAWDPGSRDPEQPFAYASDSLDMVAIGDAMQERGWFVYLERVPPSIHLMLSPGHAPFMEQYISDLTEVVELARTGAIERKREEIKYGQ